MAYQHILLSKLDNIVTLTLNRPQRANSVIPAMMNEMVSALEEIKRDKEARVMVLTGAGKVFCGGGDMAAEMDFSAWDPEAIRQMVVSQPSGITDAIYKLEIPTIAMVNGPAVGGGVEWALACDIRIGNENARFVCAQTRIGVVPDAGGCYVIPRAIGLGRALEFMFSAEPLEAAQAEKIGALNRVVPAADLEKVVMDLAKKIAKAPPIALKLDKMLTYRCLQTDWETAKNMTAAAMAVAMKSQDYKEGMAAFREKREPVYKGK